MQLDNDFTFKFDNFDLGNITWFTPTSRLPNSMPDIDLKTIQLVRNHGAIVVSQRYTKKVIMMFGYIVAPSRQAYEEAMDELKWRLSGKQRPLSIIQAGKERRYTASLSAFGEGFIEGGKTYISLTFECSDPFGRDGTNVVFEEPTFTTSTLNFSHIFEGYSEVLPTMIVTIEDIEYEDDTPIARSIYLGNTNSGQEVKVTRIWEVGDVLSIDSENQKILVNGSPPADFTGFFPSFSPRVARAAYRDDFVGRAVSARIEYQKKYL
jgi:hypothetical protein